MTPTPLPSSAFQQNAYKGDFWSLCTVTFLPSAHGNTPPPLRHADVLNGWSLTCLACLALQMENVIQKITQPIFVFGNIINQNKKRKMGWKAQKSPLFYCPVYYWLKSESQKTLPSAVVHLVRFSTTQTLLLFRSSIHFRFSTASPQKMEKSFMDDPWPLCVEYMDAQHSTQIWVKSFQKKHSYFYRYFYFQKLSNQAFYFLQYMLSPTL